jgi:putative Mg2+ transporter-C (MgtC) family protein
MSLPAGNPAAPARHPVQDRSHVPVRLAEQHCRRLHRHSPGRSCVLVAAASSVFARVATIYAPGNPGPALGAIATGIGFLGAGVILRHGTQVRGLSTAATFWAVAAIGTAAGLEEMSLAATLTLVVFFAHVALRSLSAWIERHAPPEDQGPR